MVKTVRTKKGTKRQTFWVRVNGRGSEYGRKVHLHAEKPKAPARAKPESRTARFMGHVAKVGAVAAPLIGGLVGEYAGSKHGGAAIHHLGSRMSSRGGAAGALGGLAQFHHEKIGGMAGGAVGGHLGMAVAAGLAHLARRAGAR